MRAFAASTGPGEALSAGREEACGRIGRTLRRFAYWRLGKAGEGTAETLPGARHGVVAGAGGAVGEALPGARGAGRPARLLGPVRQQPHLRHVRRLIALPLILRAAVFNARPD